MNTSSSTFKGICLSAFGTLLSAGSLLAQSSDSTDSTAAAAGGGIGGLFGLIIGIVGIVAMWKIFVKAGQPGWAAIIPIYNPKKENGRSRLALKITSAWAGYFGLVFWLFSAAEEQVGSGWKVWEPFTT